MCAADVNKKLILFFTDTRQELDTQKYLNFYPRFYSFTICFPLYAIFMFVQHVRHTKLDIKSIARKYSNINFLNANKSFLISPFHLFNSVFLFFVVFNFSFLISHKQALKYC